MIGLCSVQDPKAFEKMSEMLLMINGDGSQDDRQRDQKFANSINSTRFIIIHSVIVTLQSKANINQFFARYSEVCWST